MGAIEFIGLAEETGLIVPLGRWVLETACAQVAAWQASPGGGRRLTVSANVSPRQLAEPSFPEQLGPILRQTGIRPGAPWPRATQAAPLQAPGAASRPRRA